MICNENDIFIFGECKQVDLHSIDLIKQNKIDCFLINFQSGTMARMCFP